MKVTNVYGDFDWEGYYFDGILTCQDHSVSADELLRYLSKTDITLPFEYDVINLEDEEFDILHNKFGGLPSKLSELKETLGK